MLDLPYLYGAPTIEGVIRSCNDDFYVEEILGFQPSGQGEHLWVYIEKKGENTQFVANQLAKILGVQPREVATSGMKDRHACTRQWLSLPYPIKKPIPKNIKIDNTQILLVTRHDRKLKTGTHKANRFILKIKTPQLTSEQVNQLDERINQIKTMGVPNYFGEQRFGRHGANIQKALDLFAGKFKVKDKKKRGIYLSSARSFLFNQMIKKRIDAELFKPCVGDVFILSGSNSIFVEPALTDELLKRYSTHDIQISAALWGEGDLKSFDKIADIEQAVANEHEALAQGLCSVRMKQERRSINLHLPDISYQYSKQTIELQFDLPTGCFATAVLREIINYTDGSKHEHIAE
ncbi:tRNA pseudouridine(13) synthase TruD [Algibacillus agarilyticus]|uniref:tRNA pseudouridine(13) synthase TruD n=1 Tax=Algibacillus agarilyticus TaxID=2234133 RepID=UPI000DD04BCE|nr:tRNA pseudouridine(13) synthase TruD [Algibacillus agarilyticus]